MSTQKDAGEMERIHIASGAPWEPIVGYSRAVRFGALVSPEMLVEIEAEVIVPDGR